MIARFYLSDGAILTLLDQSEAAGYRFVMHPDDPDRADNLAGLFWGGGPSYTPADGFPIREIVEDFAKRMGDRIVSYETWYENLYKGVPEGVVY